MNRRCVPVKLIKGKEYVLWNGEQAVVYYNPDMQCNDEFPFMVMDDFNPVYLTAEGKVNLFNVAHKHDIIRPVYKQGEEYLSHDGTRYCISDDSGDGLYTLYDCDANKLWTHDGRVSHCVTSIRADDLMDYAPSTTYTQPQVEKPQTQVEKPQPRLPTERAALPVLHSHVTSSRVGMRVEVMIGYEAAGFGVIIHEDADDTCAVEFDEGTDWIGFLHNCGGRVPSGRGWWCPNDTIRVVSETESQVETESLNDIEACSNEPLTEVDTAEIWDAYKVNPTIEIDSLIAARRKLKAAAK